MTEQPTVAAPFAKASGGLLAAFGIASWSDVAAFLAALYSLIVILEWCWKKFGRGCLERRGWLKPRKRRFTDRSYE